MSILPVRVVADYTILKAMDESTLANNAQPKPVVRCTECDREVTHYNTYLTPTNEQRPVCWECRERMEKGFNAERGFFRRSRQGVIPR